MRSVASAAAPSSFFRALRAASMACPPKTTAPILAFLSSSTSFLSRSSYAIEVAYLVPTPK